ncbi:MAG: sigma-70 family RNA polymerase sigma factor, partial [Bacteroidota bacterium]
QRWQALKRGDKSALEYIYKQHASDLLSYGYRFGKDEQVAEDCLQELFVDLWNKREGLGDNDNIRKYLFVALRRRIIRQIEQRRRRSISEEPQEYHFSAELAVDELLAQAELNEEQLGRLKESLAKLSKRQREIIFLKYYSGLDYEAIGETMDLSYQSARNLLSGALRALRKSFVWMLFVLLNNFF